MQAERAHEHTHSPTPQPGVAGRSRNPSPNTRTHNAHPCQEWLGHRAPVPEVAGCKRCAHTSTHTAQYPSQEWRGAAETRAQTDTPTPHTPARSGWVTAHPCQEWLGASGARTRAHTQPNSRARSGGAHPKPEPKHTQPHLAHQPGVAGCKRSAHTNTHTAQQPSQEWRGAAQARAQAHTPKPHTPARRGGVQEEQAHQHTHTPTPQPGVTGRSLNPNPTTHTHTAHPCQEWQATSGANTQAHTHPNTQARSDGAQPKPEPNHNPDQNTSATQQ